MAAHYRSPALWDEWNDRTNAAGPVLFCTLIVTAANKFAGRIHDRMPVFLEPAIAPFERDLIKAWTHEGRKRTIANGVKMGRKPKLDHFQRKEAIRQRDTGEPVVEIARSYRVSDSTICRVRGATPMGTKFRIRINERRIHLRGWRALLVMLFVVLPFLLLLGLALGLFLFLPLAVLIAAWALLPLIIVVALLRLIWTATSSS
jgi:hypothetical protein